MSVTGTKVKDGCEMKSTKAWHKQKYFKIYWFTDLNLVDYRLKAQKKEPIKSGEICQDLHRFDNG